MDFPGLSVVSLYVPSGSSSEAAQARKDGFMEPFYEHLAALKRKRRQFIVCADWNTCHQNIDLKNWRPNRKNSGFMPHEREWLDRIYDKLGWVDIFREITDQPELVYLVVESRTGVGKQCRMAPRLHARHAGLVGLGPSAIDLSGRAFFQIMRPLIIDF